MAQDPNEKWIKEQTLIFIDIYKTFPILYDENNPNYSSQTSRSDVLQKIEQQMQDVRPGITRKEIQAKIKTLHGQIRRELKEKEKANGIDIFYRPKLWCFDQLQFLVNTAKRRTLNAKPKGPAQKTRKSNDKPTVVSSTNSSADDSLLDNDADEITIGEVIKIEQTNCTQIEEANCTQVKEANFTKIEEKQQECKTLWYRNEALKALKLSTIYAEKIRMQSKEEKFCNFLAKQMTCFKNDDDFLNATYQIMEVVWKLKSNHVQIPAQQQPPPSQLPSSNVNLELNPISSQIKCPPDEDIIDVPSSPSDCL